MKPSALWLLVVLAVLAAFLGLSSRPAWATSGGMPTIAKSKKPARKPSAKVRNLPKGALKFEARHRHADAVFSGELPPPRATADDLLRALDDGSYAKATAGIEWDKVEAAVKGRRSRILRAA